MLRRNSRGPALGPDLSIQFIETLELTLIIFAVDSVKFLILKLSSLFFQSVITDSAGSANVVAAVIGILNALLPMDWINKKLFPIDPEKIGSEKFSKCHLEFLEVFLEKFDNF
jgi:hypothetical protein